MEAYGIIGDLKDMEDVDGDELQEQKHVLFLVATYGEGEPTDNAKELWTWLNDECDTEQRPLESLRYGVFGLGNKTYEHYNWMGRQINKRLGELGAQSVVPYGEGDDDATLEDDFSEWKKLIWKPLCIELGVNWNAAEEGATLTRTWKWQVEWIEANAPAPSTAAPRERFTGKVDPKKRVYDQHHPFMTHVQNVRELFDTNATSRGCLHADVRLPKGVRYEEGDHLGVYPHNGPTLVEAYLEHFRLDGARMLRVLGNTDKDRGKVLFGPAPLRY